MARGGTVSTTSWKQGASAAGVVFVVVLVIEAVISTGVPLTQDDSSARIAVALHGIGDIGIYAPGRPIGTAQGRARPHTCGYVGDY